ncbi:MAG TPA: ABC transporter permease [Acidimicrobiales bacterium]|jgi:putative ABC transport system permease protein|nr:ABC transporter permease [Acidimicrobiales bacterium]
MAGLDNLRLSLRGLSGNKLRSALTVLGILIGVGAVIVLVAVGNGSSVAVQNDIKTLGTNTITITDTGFSSAASGAQSQSSTITEADVQALTGDQAPDVKTASPVLSTSDYVSHGDLEKTASITGSDAAYLEAEDDTISGGRDLDGSDVSGHGKVAVISSALAGEIFPAGTNPIGKEIKIGTSYFDVVGLSQTKSSASTANEYQVLIPYTTEEDEFTGYAGGFSTVVVQARSAARVDMAEDEAATVLAAANKTTLSNLPFTLVKESSLLSAAKSTNSTFAVLLAAVAGLSLLVGGIGIMNIMLVTVTERTREIGIRKAIGAPKSAVLAQFLAEAMLLAAIGGLGGIAVGLIGTHFTIAGVKPVLQWTSVVGALAVAMLTGVFFGWYPANRAASLRPIEALRYE